MADESADGWPPPGPPAAGDEVATLLGSLERQRATFAWKCGGLDAAGMQARAGASTMTLGGLVKQVTLVEAAYFASRLWGRAPGAPWNASDWDADPDWEWRTAADDAPDDLLRIWRETVDRSRAAVDEALAGGGLAGLAGFTCPSGGPRRFGLLLAALTEEHARHV